MLAKLSPALLAVVMAPIMATGLPALAQESQAGTAAQTAADAAATAADAAADAAATAADAAATAVDAATGTAAPADAAAAPAATAPAAPAAGAPAAPAVPTVSYYQKATHGDWLIRCIKTPNGADPCEMYQLMKDGQGNSVAEITLIPLEGEVVAGATLVAPLETDLIAGLNFRIDSAAPRVYPFNFCAPVGCVSRMGFPAAELASLKRGNKAVVALVPFGGDPKNPVALNMSLSGFTAAFDDLTTLVAEAKKIAAEAPAAAPAEAAPATAPAEAAPAAAAPAAEAPAAAAPAAEAPAADAPATEAPAAEAPAAEAPASN